jgi:hypothetical protein
MSDTLVTPNAEQASKRPRRQPRNSGSAPATRRQQPDVASFKNWLDGLDPLIKPKIHINGHTFTSAVLAVDFGQPLRPLKLSFEQNHEMLERMRKLTKEVVGRDTVVRISHDGPAGIYWASIG